MNNEVIDAEVIEDHVVPCPRCGQRNRVVKQARRIGYRCGACKTGLPNPFGIGFRLSQVVKATARSIKSSSSKWRPVLWIVGVLVLVVVAVVLVPPNPPWRQNDWPTPRLPQIPQQSSVQFQPQVYPIQPAKPLPPPRSLANGTMITELSRIGNGTLKIDNGTTHDAVIKVVDERAAKIVVAFYVCAGRVAQIEHIPDGDFRVLFAGGMDWDADVGNFTRDKAFAKFDEALDFVTTRTTKGYEVYKKYSVFTLTLHAVLNGNAKTTNVDEEEFLKY